MDESQLNILPFDVLRKIVVKTGLATLPNVKRVCRQFRDLIRGKEYFKVFNETDTSIWYFIGLSNPQGGLRVLAVKERGADRISFLIDFTHLLYDDEDEDKDQPLEVFPVGVWRSILLFSSLYHGFFTYNWWTGMKTRIPLRSTDRYEVDDVLRGTKIVVDPRDADHYVIAFFHQGGGRYQQQVLLQCVL